jgi:hypothetical protein
MFKRTIDVNLIERIESLYLTLAAVEGRLAEKSEALEVVADYEIVKKKLTDAEIELSKKDEEHARKMRETEHKIGLVRQQMDAESKAAKKEAELAVREEAMEQQKAEFDRQMKFREDRFQDEINATRNLMDQILTRLPSYTHSTVRHEGVTPQVVVGELPSGE